MKYEVKIDEHTYIIEALNTFEAKLQAARQHVKKYPSRFTSANDVFTKTKIRVHEASETP
jgi:hypothetical protein